MGEQGAAPVDLWKLLDRALRNYYWQGIDVAVKHAPAHVGIHGNEKADRLTKSSMRRTHRNRITISAQKQDRMLDDMAEYIVNTMLTM